MEGSSAAAATSLPMALGRLRVALDEAYSQASRNLGLTAQQAELLCAALQPAAVGSLAGELRCDSSNVTRLVERAARHDLVRRRADQLDGRITLIELTPKGRRLAERFITELESQTRALLAGWGDARARDVSAALNEIADALAAARPPAPASSRRGV